MNVQEVTIMGCNGMTKVIDMTGYNDGKWHGWNGGECPVHPKSRVQGLEPVGVFWTADAEACHWGESHE